MSDKGTKGPPAAPATPEQVMNVVTKSAAAAADSAQQAEAVRKSLEAELADAKKDRSRYTVQMVVAFGTLGISLFTLFAIVFQGWFIWDQAETTQRQLQHQERNSRIAFVQQLRSDNERIEDSIDDRSGALQIMSSADPHCELGETPPPSVDAALDRFVHQLLAHYERYYLSAQALNLSEDWEVICHSAQRLRQDYCHLENRLTPLLDRVSPDFREAFQTCELATPSET